MGTRPPSAHLAPAGHQPDAASRRPVPAPGPDPAADVARWRRATRTDLLAARAALPVSTRAAISAALVTHLLDLLAARFDTLSGRVVSLYWPIRSEPDLRGLAPALLARGASLALPVVEIEKSPLAFRPWHPGAAMTRGHWNIPVPDTTTRVTPDIALAPLVGWQSDGYRLGYGGGYFDRTLAHFPRPFAIGTGLQAARLVSIHPQPHDVRLDAIVTEAGLQWSGQ